MENISFNVFNIKKGTHTNYFDIPFLLVRATILIWWFFKKKKVRIWCKFDESCLYDFKGDEDQDDFNKLGGVNLNAFDASDQNSVMVGWRAVPKWQWFEVTPYVNKSGAAYWTYDNYRGKEVFWNMFPNELFFVEFNPINADNWKISIGKNINGKWEVKSSDFKFSVKATFMRLIPLWFGGKDSNNDGQGGVAPHDMVAYMKHEVVKD